MRNSSLIIMLVGASLFVYAFSLDAYVDKAAYEKAYLAINRVELGREASLNKFYELRKEFLTDKHRYQDYGVSFLGLVFFLMLLAKNGWGNISAPNEKWKIVLLGFSAALLTGLGNVGDLFLEFSRGSSPHWSDSLGIPLSVVPLLFIIFFGLATVSMIGMAGKFSTGAKIRKIRLRNFNWCYVGIALVMAVSVTWCLYDGYFWLLLPGLFWLYFYLSIMAGRSSAVSSVDINHS